MKIPQSFLDEYLKEIDNIRFFGIPVKDLNRDELMAIAIAGWKAEERAREEGTKQRRFLFSLLKERRLK